MTTTHVMLDIETLGVRPGFVVASAAFVRFDDLAGASLALDVPEQTALGLETDPSTVDWWSKQSAAARAAAFGNPVSLARALLYFADWLNWARNGGDLLIWCHGASFDAPMLQEVYRRANVPLPWSYRDVRDTRTLYDLACVDLRDPKYKQRTDHNALDDAIGQVKAAHDALVRLAAARGYVAA